MFLMIDKHRQSLMFDIHHTRTPVTPLMSTLTPVTAEAKTEVAQSAAPCQCSETTNTHPLTQTPRVHIPGHSWGTGVVPEPSQAPGAASGSPTDVVAAFAHCRWVADTRLLSSIVDSIVGIDQPASEGKSDSDAAPPGSIGGASACAESLPVPVPAPLDPSHESKSTVTSTAAAAPGHPARRFYPTLKDLPRDVQESFALFDSVGNGLAYSIEHDSLKGKDAAQAWEYVDLFELLHKVRASAESGSSLSHVLSPNQAVTGSATSSCSSES
jgi:hypothetical protein